MIALDVLGERAVLHADDRRVPVHGDVRPFVELLQRQRPRGLGAVLPHGAGGVGRRGTRDEDQTLVLVGVGEQRAPDILGDFAPHQRHVQLPAGQGAADTAGGVDTELEVDLRA